MAQPIVAVPTPFDRERDALGHWLSGFVDGEGCFFLGRSKKEGRNTPTAQLVIHLRADDRKALELIRRYLDCGFICDPKPYSPSSGRPGKPQANYRVRRIADLHERIVPHFERYPLRSKKARDFAIWKEGVALCYRVMCRKQRRRGMKRGWLPKWTEEDQAAFWEFHDRLRAQREYEAPDLPPPPKTWDGRTLFDGLGS